MRALNMTVANLVCRFGDKVLLDYLGEIILPAFFDSNLVRTYGEDTSYLFHKVELFTNNVGQVKRTCVIGQFVRDTVLTRDQVLDNGELLHDPQILESSPSAFFVFILENHKLIYLPETNHAPSVLAFAATLRTFVLTKHKEYIEQLSQESGATKKSLYETHQKPRLVVVPLASRESVEDFVARYKSLRRLEVRLLETNDEIDGTAVWRKLRKLKVDAGAKDTALIHSCSDGLLKDGAVHQIADASATGNALIKLSGYDYDGNKLRGNNESFQVSTSVSNLPEDLVDRGRELVNQFERMVAKGAIIVDPSVRSDAEVADLIERGLSFFDGDE